MLSFQTFLRSTELARRLQDTQVTVNALHPGYVATSILTLEGATGPWRLLRPFWGLAMRLILRPEKGAATSIYLACSPEVAGVSGGYYEKCLPVTSSRASYDRKLQLRMWEMSAELTGADAGDFLAHITTMRGKMDEQTTLASPRCGRR